MPERFTVAFYEEEGGRAPVREWLRGLPSPKRRAIGMALKEYLQELGPSVCKTPQGDALGGGLFELRVEIVSGQKFARDVPPPPFTMLVRIFCHAHGSRELLLLGGYDKRLDPSKKRQQSEIAIARKRLDAWRLRGQPK